MATDDLGRSFMAQAGSVLDIKRLRAEAERAWRGADKAVGETGQSTMDIVYIFLRYTDLVRPRAHRFPAFDSSVRDDIRHASGSVIGSDSDCQSGGGGRPTQGSEREAGSLRRVASVLRRARLADCLALADVWLAR